MFRALRPDSTLASRNGRFPVVYRLDLSNPNSMFMEQQFQVANRDLLFVSNAPSVGFQKAVDIFNGIVAPVTQSTYAAASAATIK